MLKLNSIILIIIPKASSCCGFFLSIVAATIKIIIWDEIMQSEEDFNAEKARYQAETEALKK